ncbi:MAG: hypothetical protein ACRES5_04425 [Pseudomonas sp.]
MIADLLHTDLPAQEWGNKAARLSQISQLGLAVPPGLCIRYSKLMRSTSVKGWRPGSIFTSPTWWSFACHHILEDRPESANAGRTISLLDCPPDAQALLRVLQHDIVPQVEPWHEEDGGVSFIFQEQIRAQITGVAFSSERNLWVECSRGSTYAVTSGVEPELRIEIHDREARAEGSEVAMMPVVALATRLRMACNNLSNYYGHDLDIEWAWASGALFVLQARPLTVAPWTCAS